MADKERWAIITPQSTQITVEFPVYPNDADVAAARKKITCIHGAVLPDPPGESEFIHAALRPPSIPLRTRRRLLQIREQDPGAIPSVMRELTSFESEMADLSTQERRCIRRVIGELEELAQR